MPTTTTAAQPIALWPGQPTSPEPLGQHATLTPYLLDGDAPRPVVLVLHGGGYWGLAPHEGEPIARRMNSAGFHAAVLRYRTAAAGHRHPAMLHDVQRAVRVLRDRAESWHIDPRGVAVLGFSAGGHLAASSATLHGQHTCADDDLAGRCSDRPDAAVLCYPVIDLAGVAAHSGSCRNLLGDPPAAGMPEQMSLHTRVDAHTPPTFLWHTAEDAGVPVENALLFAAACRAAGVPFELHVFERGRHGVGLADGNGCPDLPDVAPWADLCVAFLRRHLTRNDDAGAAGSSA